MLTVFLQLQDLARHVHGDLLRQVAAGDGGCDVGDVADLGGEVARHEVDAVGQSPSRCRRHRARCAWPPSLPSVPTSRATRVTSEANELSWSTIVLMGVLELENFAAHVDGDFAGQVAAGDGGGHLRDVTNLVGQVAGTWR